MKNNSIDKMAEQFNSPEELKAYSEAQYKTILKQNEKINELEAKVAKLEQENKTLVQKTAADKVSDGESNQFQVSDEEATCVVQIALIKNNAMERELTMDETKRLEIYVKTLQVIRGKDVAPKSKEEKKIENMSNEELTKHLDSVLKS